MATRARRLAIRGSALLAGGTIAWLAAASGAAAHVTVDAPGVAIGASDAAITFRVPTESDAASTVGLRLQLPIATPLAGVLVAPIQGWSAKIIQTKLGTPIHTDDGDITQVVSEIDWSAAAAGGVKPGFFGEFTIIAGKLPNKVSTLTFKAIQTYSDGKVVSWIQQSAPGSAAQPDFPAPTLQLSAGTSTTSTPSPTSAAPTVSAQPASKDAASKSAATTGIVLGAIGALLGAAALALVVTRGRQPR